MNSIVSDSIIVDAGKTLEINGTVTVNDYVELSGIPSSPTYLSGNGSTDSLLVASGNLCFEYLRVSNVNAGGGATFYAGQGSVDNGGNSGWIFNVITPCVQFQKTYVPDDNFETYLEANGQTVSWDPRWYG